jgi:hypothetical protein
MRALLASTALSLLAAPALAQTPCAEQIATIERRLNSEGAVAVTGSHEPAGPGAGRGLAEGVPAPAGTSSTDAPARHVSGSPPPAPRSRRPAASTGRATRRPATTP